MAEIVANVARMVDDFRVGRLLMLWRSTLLGTTVMAEVRHKLTQRWPIAVSVTTAARVQPQFILGF